MCSDWCSGEAAPTAEVAAEFREAIRLRPEFAEAHNQPRTRVDSGGDDNAGIAALREAVRLRPDDAERSHNLGAALTPTDAEAAIRELEQAVALAPTSSTRSSIWRSHTAPARIRGPAKEIETCAK